MKSFLFLLLVCALLFYGGVATNESGIIILSVIYIVIIFIDYIGELINKKK